MTDALDYKLYIFDFDGTLADSGKWMVGAMRDMADRHGFRKPNDDEVEYLRGLPNRDILKWLEVPAWRLPLIARDIRKLASTAEIDVFPGAPEVLRGLAERGHQLAIVSSNSRENVERVLGRASSHFSWFECGSSLFGKARRIKRVLKDSGTSSSEALLVGDETRDVEAAASVGVAAAAVSWGYATSDALAAARPAHLINGLHELLTLKRPSLQV